MTQSAIQGSRQAIEQAVARFFHMCNTHCPGNLAPLMTADIEVEVGRRAQGQDQVHALLVWLWEGYPELTIRVEQILVDESSAAAEVTYTGGSGERGAACVLFQFRGDLIRRVRAY